MKRLCVFYYRAHEWSGKPVEWIVCKECSRRIAKGEKLISVLPNVKTARAKNTA